MNAILRGTAAVIMVVVVNRSLLMELMPETAGQTVILGHVLFNALLLLAVPFSGLLGTITAR